MRIGSFTKFINKIYILFYDFIEFIIPLYTLLVTSFDRCKEDMICLILFSNFLDAVAAFICAKAIGNLWSIYLGVYILIPFQFFALYLALDATVT